MLLLTNSDTLTDEELKSLHDILKAAETPAQFCIAHELVDRNSISNSPKKILKESRHFFLRPFRFLINKN